MMPFLLRLSKEGGGQQQQQQQQQHGRKRNLLSLKRTPTFATLLRKEVTSLRTFDPMFRYSLTRLPEEEMGRRGGAVDGGGEGRCGVQWENVRGAVEKVVTSCVVASTTKDVCKSPLADGELSALHSDVRVLLRSEAGVFIFEYLKDRLLPGAAEAVLKEVKKRSASCGGDEVGSNAGSRRDKERRAIFEEVREDLDPRKLCSVLSSTWEHFYSHSLPLLEAIFYQVKSRNLGIRQAGLITFRDHIILPLKAEIEVILESYIPAGELYRASKKEVPPTIKQMLLILQGVNECCPPSNERLKLEQLVARAITPYLGFRGLYEGGNPKPSKPSQELEVIHKRRPSVVDPRHLSRPLSVAGAGQVETLSELFILSADRIRQKRTFHRQNTHPDL